MTDFSVHDQEGFARVYDEDEMVSVRKGDLRALLDIATGMEFGSNMLNNEEVEILRSAAVVLGIPVCTVTQSNMHDTYDDVHEFGEWTERSWTEWPPLPSGRPDYGAGLQPVGTRHYRTCKHCYTDESYYTDLDGNRVVKR